MKSLPGLREEVARHVVLGVLAVGMGVYILLVVDKTLPSMIAALLFLTGGAYWSVAAIPVAKLVAAFAFSSWRNFSSKAATVGLVFRP